MKAFPATLFLPIVAIAASASSAAQARLPTGPWQPAGEWTLHKRHICSAYKRYRSGNAEILVSFKPSPTAGLMRLSFEVPSDIRAYGVTLASAKIGSQPLADIKTMSVAPSTNRGRLIYSLAADLPLLAALKRGETLSFKTRSLALAIAMPDIDSAIAKSNPCISDLLAEWGFSRDHQARLATFPAPVTGQQFKYPREAERKSALGDVEGRVTVGADGSVSDCKILLSSGHPSLDSETCTSYSGFRFSPARLQDGTPVSSPYFFFIGYRLGD